MLTWGTHQLILVLRNEMFFDNDFLPCGIITNQATETHLVCFLVSKANSPVLKLLLTDICSCNPLNDGDAVVPIDYSFY